MAWLRALCDTAGQREGKALLHSLRHGEPVEGCKRPQGAHHLRGLELAETQGMGGEAVSESQDVLCCWVGAILHLARSE